MLKVTGLLGVRGNLISPFMQFSLEAPENILALPCRLQGQPEGERERTKSFSEY